MTVYFQIPQSAVPQGITWTVPGRDQGQTVETAYSRGHQIRAGANAEAGHGDPYRRYTDMSAAIGEQVTYWHAVRKLTAAEQKVLEAAHDVFSWQPREGQLAATNALYGLGLLTARPGFDVTITTDLGDKVYWDILDDLRPADAVLVGDTYETSDLRKFIDDAMWARA